MRPTLIASLVLSPLFITAAAFASTPASDAPASAPTRQISTGVTPVQVIYSPDVQLSSAVEVPQDAAVVLQLSVDENGQPHDIKVVKAFSQELEQPVLDAVSKFRFRPAKLDNQAVAMPLNLTVLVQK